jgi:hypothetical protein
VKSETNIGNQTISDFNLKSEGDVETTIMIDEVTAMMFIVQQLSDAYHRS